jgi:hypothetical protein
LIPDFEDTTLEGTRAVKAAPKAHIPLCAKQLRNEGAKGEATHSTTFAVALIVLCHFTPKNRMSSPKTPKSIETNHILVAF